MRRPVTELRNVGAGKAKVLAEVGIHSVGDLLNYFPRRYLDRSLARDQEPVVGETMTLIVRVVNTYLAHGRRSRLLAHCRTEGNHPLTLVFFSNTAYFRRALKAEQQYVVSGKIDFFKGLQITHPEFEPLDDDGDEAELVHVGRIVPLYASTEALKKQYLDSRGFRRLMSAALQLSDLEVSEVLPAELTRKYGYIDRLTALRAMHFPEDDELLERARARLVYEELYLFHHLMYHKRLKRESVPRELWPLPIGKAKSHDALIERLPFKLTGEQERAVKIILGHCGEDHAEAFLLQGDVGSGKTVTALLVALHFIENDIQVALMAPTEVLARQHFRVLSDLCGMGMGLGLSPEVRLELVLGGDRKKAREEARDRIARGESNLVIGTHSLLEEDLRFSELGLVIIDEQHRFGVEQRETLRRKGRNPDLIVMTATPIPRTLSLTGFADLRLVTLKEKPAGRKPIKTMWLREDRRAGMYKSVHKHVSEGRQCFIVYPVIEESEKLDLRTATEAYEELRTLIFPDFRVDLLHGRLKAADKERVMNEFREGRVSILVTTTVIEVGVDVPNATVMIIEHAERFGISQLHQLRGRVGRGTHESFCVLMSDAEPEDDAARRLEAVVASEDGFHLAEVDMDIRGPGELLGLRQHGLPGFRLADLTRHKEQAERAFEDVRRYPLGEEAREIIRSRFAEGIVVFPT